MKFFADNKDRIARHNQLYSQGLESFDMKINKYGDKLPHEFVSTMNGLKGLYSPENKEKRLKSSFTFIAPDESVVLPKSVDWRTKGAVTPVKDQGDCGSCYAFGTTGALEAQHFRKTGKLVSLSEQNVIDCSSFFGNSGCDGGRIDSVFQYIKENKGIDTEESYPYNATVGKCRFNRKTVGAEDSGFVDIKEGNEDELMKAVALIGPVTVGIDARSDKFLAYKSGIYWNKWCSPADIDHAVLVIGFGTEDGKDYWLVKNSWGTSWGMDGYFKLARNAQNMCGVASMASYPLV
ncbi:UNVERIFIED_CONTAM: hypothetical protein GTU68_011866 [Idotea baltica]|nr:hypothetical protein [Idotea baltica]